MKVLSVFFTFACLVFAANAEKGAVFVDAEKGAVVEEARYGQIVILVLCVFVLIFPTNCAWYNSVLGHRTWNTTKKKANHLHFLSYSFFLTFANISLFI